MEPGKPTAPFAERARIDADTVNLGRLGAQNVSRAGFELRPALLKARAPLRRRSTCQRRGIIDRLTRDTDDDVPSPPPGNQSELVAIDDLVGLEGDAVWAQANPAIG